MPRRETHDRQPRGASAIRYAVVAVVFLALGVGAAAAVNGLRPASSTDTPAADPAVVPAQDQAPTSSSVSNAAIEAPSGPADTPKAAVAQFLAAEQRGDFAASYELLAPETREAVGTPAQWIAAHADLPDVTGWELEAVQGDDEVAQVIGVVGFKPGLDEVVGLTPSSASATWQVVAEDGLWFVDYDNSDLLPRYPSDEQASAAVAEWVAAAQRCEPGPQYDGGLLGRKALAESLCQAEGEPQVGAARELDVLELDVLLPAFGSDAEAWARAVDVAGPVELRALVAPLGDDWIVVGVLPPA